MGDLIGYARVSATDQDPALQATSAEVVYRAPPRDPF